MRPVMLVIGPVLLSAFIYREAFSAYFFQDDWFTLRISNAQTVSDFFRFFAPRSDVIYYRPLGMQVLFFALYRMFGLNSLPFHVFMLSVVGGISLLSYHVYYQLTNSRENAAIGAFLIATSAIHFIPFFWASTMAFPFGFFFILTALLSYLSYVKTRKRLYLVSMVLCQVFGLLTNEQAMLIVPIIFFNMILLSTFSKIPLLLLLPFPVLYIVLRLSFLPSLDNTYALSIGTSTIKAAGVYALWLLNWPDELKNQLNNILVGNTIFLTTFPWLIFWMSVLTAASVGIIGSELARVHQKERKGKALLFYLCVAILGVVMPLAFPYHAYPYYLHVSAFGAYGIVAMGLLNFPKTIRYGFLALWVIGSGVSTHFSTLNHWAVQRSEISRIIVRHMLVEYPLLKPGEVVYVPNDPYLKVNFSDQEAARIIYSDDRAEMLYYGKEDPIWKDIPRDKPDRIEERLHRIYVK